MAPFLGVSGLGLRALGLKGAGIYSLNSKPYVRSSPRSWGLRNPKKPAKAFVPSDKLMSACNSEPS